MIDLNNIYIYIYIYIPGGGGPAKSDDFGKVNENLHQNFFTKILRAGGRYSDYLYRKAEKGKLDFNKLRK